MFRKGDLLYGLDRARTAIAREERALIVEGNTDVLALRQAGLGPVVASMGTALTERQLKELSRLTRKLYLCFDADAAGEAATLRGMDLAAAQGMPGSATSTLRVSFVVRPVLSITVAPEQIDFGDVPIESQNTFRAQTPLNIQVKSNAPWMLAGRVTEVLHREGGTKAGAGETSGGFCCLM